MTAVETVIRKLVSDYEFVIIPGFGALLSRQIHASFDKESCVFAPPVKKLAFNEFLKLDDGLMANYISREEKVTHPEAVSYVKQYAESLRLTLNATGQTKITGVGVFRTNVEGKLVFEPDTDNHFKDEWYGFGKVTVKTFEKALADSDIEHEENEVEVIQFNERKVVKVNWMRWASAAVVAGLVLYVSFFLVTSGKDNYKSTLNPFNNFFQARNESIVVKEIEKETPVEHAVVPIATDGISLSENRKNEGVVLDSSVSRPAFDGGTVVVKNGEAVIDRKFYLIAGAFKGMRRANVLREELVKKGYENALVIPSGKHSSKVTVAVEGFDEEREAYLASSKLKKAIGQQGWVMKMK